MSTAGDWDANENAPNFLGRHAAAALKELAALQPGEKIKAGIARAARLAGLSFWRASDIHYGKARRIEQFEAAALAEALDKRRREAARNELHELKKRLAILEARLATNDPEFHRPTIDALGALLRAGGRSAG